MFDGFVVMSGGHCTHPTGGPAIRLKHKKKTYLNAGLAIQVKPCTGVLGFCWETSIFGVWFGHNFSFLECGLLWSVVRVSCGFFCSFSFSVTLPGTNAPHSAVTRGKPSLFWFLFSRFQGSLSPPFVLFCWYFI